jgi:hypothetical protein
MWGRFSEVAEKLCLERSSAGETACATTSDQHFAGSGGAGGFACQEFFSSLS